MSRFDAQFAGRLDGQTVLVTGANGAIGHETAVPPRHGRGDGRRRQLRRWRREFDDGPRAAKPTPGARVTQGPHRLRELFVGRLIVR